MAETWSLSDVHPVTGRTYFESLWHELPGPLCEVLADVYGWFDRAAWDEAVQERRAGTRPAVDEQPVIQVRQVGRGDGQPLPARQRALEALPDDVPVVDLDALTDAPTTPTTQGVWIA